jgi:uncharacterized protein YgbK (DUF1537 family)
MYNSVKETMAQLPPEFTGDVLTAIREEFIQSGKTIVVLDDDPTGTQTCRDVTVLIAWQVDLIAAELKKEPSILFILTNSRSLPESQAVQLTREIGKNIQAACAISGREVVIISRSDSTLRGHFPAEVDAIAEEMDMEEAVVLLVPAFIEGGRVTINDVHYLIEDQKLIPVSATPFAEDVVFGYHHANLKAWVEEKTKGRVMAADVTSVSLNDIRVGGPPVVSDKLKSCQSGSVCIINAVSQKDLEVVVMGLLLAEKSGKTFLCRSSATLVPIRAGMESGQPFSPGQANMQAETGGLIVVGSYVPKTTNQLTWLLTTGDVETVEVNVGDLLRSTDTSVQAESISHQLDSWLLARKNVVLYTSRLLETGADSVSSLRINALVSDFLVSIVKGLTIRPGFMIAKGGITSSDLASRALSAEKAWVLGAIIPGVPVWQMDQKSKFPGISYVVFPGNVGDNTALEEVVSKFIR